MIFFDACSSKLSIPKCSKKVTADGLATYVLLFFGMAVAALGLLYFRRRMWGGELGGPTVPKLLSGLYFFASFGVFIGLAIMWDGQAAAEDAAKPSDGQLAEKGGGDAKEKANAFLEIAKVHCFVATFPFIFSTAMYLGGSWTFMVFRFLPGTCSHSLLVSDYLSSTVLPQVVGRSLVQNLSGAGPPVDLSGRILPGPFSWWS